MLQGQQHKLTYALNKEGNLVHVDSVPNGNGCDCICPCCKKELCAKNGGDQRIHHFAHLGGADCANGIESALHLMAKDILQKVKSIRLPAIANVCKSKLLHLDKVDIEVYDESTALRPDCVGRYGDKIIWIEFKRTHAVDKKKKGKIISKRIDCIEIDLNGCELDPRKVEDLLLNQRENRIWIYNSEHHFSYSKKVNTSIQDRYYNECCYHEESDYDYRIERTYAFDENNILVQLDNIEEIDMNTHNYFCLGCGKEVGIDVNSDGSYSLTHIDDDVDCDDKVYLIEAAKAILYDNFYSSEKFEIAINQTHVCCNHADCKLYLEDECCTRKPKVFDLKSLGYNRCEKDKIIQDANIHLYLSRQDENDSGMGIIIKLGNNDTIASSSLRIIEIKVFYERNLNSLKCNNLKDFYEYKTFNFKTKLIFDRDYSGILRKIPTFILYPSGKSYVIETSCKEISKQKKTNTVTLYLTNFDLDFHPHDDAYTLGLMYCLKKGIKACYCNICYFLTHTTMDDKICRCYKTKGTPHYPLEVAPVNCPYFSLNRNSARIIEEKYRDVKISEILP